MGIYGALNCCGLWNVLAMYYLLDTLAHKHRKDIEFRRDTLYVDINYIAF